MQLVKTFFITGATGAIGSALVPRLLEDPAAQVRLLLRAESTEALEQRLETLFRFWGVGPEDVAFRRRVSGLRGDVTVPRFGLADVDYSELAASCTHIVHAAGNVRMNLLLDAARRSSVDSARHVVALARACPGLRKVEFVSTVGVGGRLQLVPEEWLTGPRRFHNTYEQAKAEAEDLLREEIARDRLPVTVHRPSMVVGDSQTGKIIHFQVFYYLCEFLSGRQTGGVLPRLNGVQLDTIPVDYVADVLCWSVGREDTAGEILHLCSGPDQAMELPWLIDALRRFHLAGGARLPRLRQVPLWLFEGVLPALKVLADAKSRRALNNLALFLDYAGDRQRFANTQTAQRLSQAGIDVPKPAGYLSNVLTAYLKNKKAGLD